MNPALRRNLSFEEKVSHGITTLSTDDIEDLLVATDICVYLADDEGITDLDDVKDAFTRAERIRYSVDEWVGVFAEALGDMETNEDGARKRLLCYLKGFIDEFE